MLKPLVLVGLLRFLVGFARSYDSDGLEAIETIRSSNSVADLARSVDASDGRLGIPVAAGHF